ncbi:unnamed protein product [Cyclocybe aegerita]|uniref:Cysteine protease n=1 Tax=Cyclocybe aegerita TaxID=1973307 RepID=A0A8S0W5M0_CYCAE|nr:unnamed protein product [Cyclocybe aegerita]
MDHRELGMFGGSGSRGSTNNSFSASNSNSTNNSFDMNARVGESGSGLDPVQMHYCAAYSAADLKTFHRERVRKMPLSGLDPSMLIGFLYSDEADWWDFKRRVGEAWSQISEPEDNNLNKDGVEVDGRGEGDDSENEDNEDDGDGDNEQFFDTQSSGAGSGQERSERGRSDVDMEEDMVDPVTPGPGSSTTAASTNTGVDEGAIAIASFLLQLSAARKGQTVLIVQTCIKFRKWQEIEEDPQTDTHSCSAVRLPPTTSSNTKNTTLFPVAPADDGADSPHGEKNWSRSSSTKDDVNVGGKRMHTARARDGGRTLSIGVEGILTDD